MQAYLQQLERLKAALQIESDTAFSQVLAVSQGAISGAKKRGQIPHSWFFQVHEKTKVSIDWLYCGCGTMRQDDTSQLLQEPHNNAQSATFDTTVLCAKCIKLEDKLERVEEERRDLSNENRELSTENRRLWKENGDLRERCATLEERKVCCDSGENRIQNAGVRGQLGAA